MRMICLFLVLTIFCVVGIDQATTKPFVPMDQWRYEPLLKKIQTNTGPLYYYE